MRLSVRKNAEMPFLPRFGVRLFLPKACCQPRSITATGRRKAMRTSTCGTRLGLFHTTAKENHEDYIKPQENGSHCRLRFRDRLTDRRGAGLCVQSDAPFSMNLSPYTQEELTEKQHNYELSESESYRAVRRLRATAAWAPTAAAPHLPEKYRLNETEFYFHPADSPVG